MCIWIFKGLRTIRPYISKMEYDLESFTIPALIGVVTIATVLECVAIWFSLYRYELRRDLYGMGYDAEADADAEEVATAVPEPERDTEDVPRAYIRKIRSHDKFDCISAASSPRSK